MKPERNPVLRLKADHRRDGTRSQRAKDRSRTRRQQRALRGKA